MKNIFLIIGLYLYTAQLQAQVGIGTTDPDPSAALHIAGTNNGLLTPRLTLSERNHISNPATGLLIYQTNNTPGFYFNAGAPGAPDWVKIATLNEISLTPAGVIQAFAGSVAPEGYLLCNGQAVSRASYAGLFAAIGTSYGAGNGSTTFNLPDLRGRTAIGAGAGTGLSNRALAAAGGAETHTLTVDQIPSHNHDGSTNSSGAHTHSITDPGHSHSLTSMASGTGNYIDHDVSGSSNSSQSYPSSIGASTTGISIKSGGSHSHTISSQGGGQAHNNMQPFLTLNYIIKY
ncbi:MAG: tail fiber protein [Chitinophagaceae bacterium]|nr:tail fiber protein [Chitinophagaceae bacterium]